MALQFALQQNLKIISNITGHQFKIGDIVKVIKIYDGINVYVCQQVNNEKNVWAVKPDDLSAII